MATELPSRAQVVIIGGGVIGTSVAYDRDDAPIELARDHHRGDRARFVVQVSTSGIEEG